jgi:hypothetical protein
MAAELTDRGVPNWLIVLGPRHIVTEFQDVGGAGALGEEEGPQAAHTTSHRIFHYANKNLSLLNLLQLDFVMPYLHTESSIMQRIIFHYANKNLALLNLLQLEFRHALITHRILYYAENNLSLCKQESFLTQSAAVRFRHALLTHRIKHYRYAENNLSLCKQESCRTQSAAVRISPCPNYTQNLILCRE